MANALRNFTIAAAFAAVFAVTAAPANAGGLFGEGGIFRGTVGNFLDKTVEKPLLTPASKMIPGLILNGLLKQ